MAYCEKLAKRVRQILEPTEGVTERKMFGGVAFMISGNMCCGVVEEELMLRLGPERAQKFLQEQHTREMDFTGRVIKSMIYVKPAGIRTKASLMKWVGRAIDFVAGLPAK
jgi:TfoX/Sxy family transcriptional regulator of competence genes